MKKLFVFLLTIALLVPAGCTKPAGSMENAIVSGSTGGDEPDEWGITLSAEDVTPTGMKLVCTQSGGSAQGELQTGSAFSIEQATDGTWLPVPTAQGILDWAWTMEAWMIPREDTVRWEVDWEFLYGVLEPGIYRLSKQITDFRGPGQSAQKIYCAEFAITD